MPIRTSPAPAGVREALQDGLSQIRGGATREAPAAALSAGSPERWQEGMPHPIFHLGLDAITAGRGTGAAEPVGWRYLIGQPQARPSVAAEIHTEARDQRPTFAGLNRGPFVGQMLDVLVRTEARPEVGQGDFEPRMLRIPALYIVALWLKERTSGEDLFIPLDPTHPALTPGRVYTAGEFEAAIRRAAEEQRAAVPPNADEEKGPHAP